MGAATLTTNLEINNPTCEVVILTISDTETYTSKKFGTVLGAIATFNQDQASISIPISLDISGGTVTFNCTGTSDELVCMTLYGRK